MQTLFLIKPRQPLQEMLFLEKLLIGDGLWEGLNA